MENQYVTDAFSIVHPITLTHGKHSVVYDSHNKRYIDFIGGIGVLNFGHCHPKIIEAIKTQAEQLTHYAYNAAWHKPYQDYISRLCNYIPINAPLSGMLTNSGAEATENALKIARQKTGKTGVVAFDGGFHGRTLASVNLNGKVHPYKTKLGTLFSGVYHLPYPSKDTDTSVQDAINALDRLLSVEIDVANVGAVIIEPVQGEGGFLALDAEFAHYLRNFCDKHDIVLIFDEIQSGFGRTGIPFAFSRLGIEPDILLLAKSIAGGLPLGAVIGKTTFMDGLHKGSLGGTYSGNPIACQAALAILDIMQDDDTWQAAKAYETTLLNTVSEWQKQKVSPWLAGVTGVGAMRGIILQHPIHGTHPKIMEQVLSDARNKGLLLMPSGKYRHIIRLLPPITIDETTLQEGLQILKQVLACLPEQPNA